MIECLCKVQYGLKETFGGKMVNTAQFEWSDTTEKEETLKVNIPPNTKLYVWQFQMGFGEKNNLFSIDTKITYNETPPEKPLKYFKH